MPKVNSSSLFLIIFAFFTTSTRVCMTQNNNLISLNLTTQNMMESSLCKLLLKLNTSTVSNLEKINFNDDTSSDYKFLTGLDNSQNRALVAARNKVELVLIHFIDTDNYKEYLLKVNTILSWWIFDEL
jgi:hypothetical protein